MINKILLVIAIAFSINVSGQILDTIEGQERKIRTAINDRFNFEARVERLVNDSLKKIGVEVVKAKGMSIIKDNQKLVDLSFWPFDNIRKMMIRQNDTSYTYLGFNGQGGLISKKGYKFIDNEFIADGIHYFFDDNGVLTSYYTYKNGKYEGKCNYYYENGKLSSTGQYINGVEVGTWLDYSRKGEIIKKVRYGKNRLYKQETFGNPSGYNVQLKVSLDLNDDLGYDEMVKSEKLVFKFGDNVLNTVDVLKNEKGGKSIVSGLSILEKKGKKYYQIELFKANGEPEVSQVYSTNGILLLYCETIKGNVRYRFIRKGISKDYFSKAKVINARDLTSFFI